MQGLKLIPLVALLVFTGCAGTMNESECLTVDWYTIGYEDGSLGYPTSRVGQHRKACAKHGVAPEFSAYYNGREHGLEEYCQPSKGFSLGERGGHYTGVCPTEFEPEFVASYNRGAELFTLRRNVQNAQNQINYKKSELKRVQELIRTKEAALIARETPVEERIMLIADIKDLSEETGELEAEIDELIFRLANHERELTAYEATLASTYSG